MSSTFPFLPRKVAASSKKQNVQAQPLDPGRTEETGGSSSRDVSDAIQREGKGKEKATAAEQRTSKVTDDDYAHLVCLALSDYALWSDPQLRRALDPAQAEDDLLICEIIDVLNYPLDIPLNDVFKRLLPSFGLVSPQTTALVGTVKALRAYAAELIDVRLLLEEPSDGWRRAGGSSTGSKSFGGYELCRKDWTRESTPTQLSYSRHDWQERTVYVERIPTQYRSIPGVLRLIANLLPGGSTIHPLTRIQGVTLPAHHQDKPGDTPTFKDFCLVILASVEDAEFLTKEWQWNRNTAGGTDTIYEGEVKGDFEVAKEATRFGFRALKKADWERLREEYLNYRARLIQEINEYEDGQVEMQIVGKREREEEAVEAHIQQHSINAAVQLPPKPIPLSPNAPYPYGCLVFVRNIHPETNKTTLRALFSSIFQHEALGESTLKKDGLDYVDFNKGVDSCYLRLSTPAHADAVVLHFTEQQLIQVNGLDDRGTPVDPSSKVKAIVLDNVTGKREEVYWERVPEKVRKQAVQKMIALAEGGERSGEVGPEAPKKRRRKD
ncbi:hypothetical protein F5887DRAFT_1137510 [Amanita rubescens]|nr:hypothetical protein F5887DRAFT_1137510 [Amanita rubescens]